MNINGAIIGGEWVVNVRADTPYFSWGCNKFHTHTADKKHVVKRQLMRFLNQLTDYSIDKKPLITAINALR